MPQLLSRLLHKASLERPEHPAVEAGAESLTYAGLARSASRLASELRAHGVQPHDRVGLLLPKSPAAVTTLYGIMWAGAAYVPLDVGSPVSRLLYMIRDCGMQVLVTNSAQRRRLGDGVERTDLQQIILVDGGIDGTSAGAGSVATTGWDELNRHEALAEPVDVAPDALAYILYTSGTTGEPKGVMISHHNAMAFVVWARAEFGVEAQDRLSSHAPFHFDLSVFDLYVACLAGATVVLIPDTLLVFPLELAAWIEEQGITVWYSVPSALVQLIAHGAVERFRYPRLRRMLFAGEVFASKYLRRWMRHVPQAEWYNLYGPTETNVCTFYKVSGPVRGEAPVPIGSDCSGDTIFLRDKKGAAIGVPGVEGEVCVVGPTVALGYWNDPLKTAERFVVEPLLSGGEQTVYRTGDLAHRDESGMLVFHGRRDHMIKSRGYRIELGEIEVAALDGAEVQEVAAIPVLDPELGNRIVLYVARTARAAVDLAQIEQQLSRKLPRYMLPAEIRFLDVLPKTSTGKIDRPELIRMATKGD